MVISVKLIKIHTDDFLIAFHLTFSEQHEQVAFYIEHIPLQTMEKLHIAHVKCHLNVLAG